MTKLGVTPGVHGDAEEKVADEKPVDTIKVDPKMFTVLQPTVIPIQAPQPPPRPPRRSLAGCIIRGVLLFLLFISCFTAGMVLIYGVDTIYNGLIGSGQSSATTTPATVEPLGLVNPMGNSMNANNEQKPGTEDEVKIFFNTIPLGKVMVIEGGNAADGAKEQQQQQQQQQQQPQREFNERPMHPYEQQEAPFDMLGNRMMMNMPPPPPYWALQARAMAHAQMMRQWRLRRLQQAMFEQQMMREAMLRAEWEQYQMEQQRRAMLENQVARAVAQARWEQTQRARAIEEYQRAQWAQAQRAAQFERMQMAQAAAAQQQQQQQQNQQQQQYWWNAQQQQQQQQQYYQDPNYAQYYYPQQQQQAAYQQQYYPNQQAQWPAVQQQQPQQEMPTRPHDASPAQILSMQQPTVPPAPEMGMHDKIYQEMQKKSQGMEFNVPSRPIWTAITPTPETPTGNYDHDAIFQENLKKINENPSLTSTTAAPAVETTTAAEVKQVEGDNVFRDILSVFDEAEKKGEMPTSTEIAFKTSEDEKSISTEAPKMDKEPEKEMVDTAVQVDIPTPSTNIFKSVEDAKPEEVQVSEEERDNQPAPVVIEDRFPRIEDRTTVATEITTAAPDSESDEDMEHDPLAAFLRYIRLGTFEQEAQKMNDSKSKPPAVVDSEVRKVEDTKPEQPAAVDEPEPHFQGFQNVPRMITV
ncbi:hypothetical protein Q1695_014788 [Nippostrongylus brasiliensis]|nr:hypothetical protein Q1695_014788 [Nippostrongylus brasiliensis]